MALEQRHEGHQLVASLIVPLENAQAAAAAEHRQRVRLAGGDYRALEVYCQRCRVAYPRTDTTPCTTGPHLYGGWGGPSPRVR